MINYVKRFTTGQLREPFLVSHEPAATRKVVRDAASAAVDVLTARPAAGVYLACLTVRSAAVT
jgi:hypothetical protein